MFSILKREFIFSRLGGLILAAGIGVKFLHQHLPPLQVVGKDSINLPALS